MSNKFADLPAKVVNMAGEKFGNLVVLEFVGISTTHHAIWKCLCSCGREVRVVRSSLVSGKTQSCGCLNREVSRQRATTHGKYGTQLYKTWRGIIARCCISSASGYSNYGGRGIRICDEWRENFIAFSDYVSSLPGFGRKGYSIDRIDNNGDYKPGNVRWSTAKTQGQNRRNTVAISFNGKTLPASEWAKELGISPVTLRWRIRAGWSAEMALTTKDGRHVK